MSIVNRLKWFGSCVGIITTFLICVIVVTLEDWIEKRTAAITKEKEVDNA